MSMTDIRKAFGATPVKQADGTYTPSDASAVLAIPDKTDFHPQDHDHPYRGDKHVLALCTEESELKCTNGKVFRTGNHPVELFLIILHLEHAGFVVDLATPTGKPVKLEEWAIPHGDDIITNAIRDHQAKLDHPLSLEAVQANLLEESPYLAAYVPGGHGATLGLPTSKAVKAVLNWFITNNAPIVAICHGPAAFLSLSLDIDPKNFPLAGYEIVCFPHAGDEMLASAGYLPGPMPSFFDEDLTKLGMKVLDTLPTGGTHVDRILITGDSPMAGDKLGQLAATELLAYAKA